MRLNTFIHILCLGLAGCTRVEVHSKKEPTNEFSIHFRPAFDESAEIKFSESRDRVKVKMLFRPRNYQDGNTDTSYFLEQDLSKSVYNEFRLAVETKMTKAQSSNWTGCCDGMPIWYVRTLGADTSILYLRSPRQSSDSVGYLMTKAALNRISLFVSDTAVRKYFRTIESYIED